MDRINQVQAALETLQLKVSAQESQIKNLQLELMRVRLAVRKGSRRQYALYRGAWQQRVRADSAALRVRCCMNRRSVCARRRGSRRATR